MAAGTTTFRATASGPAPSDVLDALVAAGFTTEPPRTSTLAVLDTFDGRIADAGLRLGSSTVVTSCSAARVACPPESPCPRQPRVADDLPAGPLRHRLARLLDVRALLRLVEVTSQRTEAVRRNGTGKVTAAVTVHQSPSTNGTDLGATVLVEVTELTGYPKPAAELRDLLEGLGLEQVDGGLAEVAATSAGVSLGGYGVSVGVPLAASDTAIDGYRAVLANLRDAMLANWDGTVADIDPEFLHDLRVAVRRTRVVLANAGRVLPDDVRQRAREDFGWLGGISGAARDLDVYQIEWPDYTADSRRHRH